MILVITLSWVILSDNFIIVDDQCFFLDVGPGKCGHECKNEHPISGLTKRVLEAEY